MLGRCHDGPRIGLQQMWLLLLLVFAGDRCRGLGQGGGLAGLRLGLGGDEDMLWVGVLAVGGASGVFPRGTLLVVVMLLLVHDRGAACYTGGWGKGALGSGGGGHHRDGDDGDGQRGRGWLGWQWGQPALRAAGLLHPGDVVVVVVVMVVVVTVHPDGLRHCRRLRPLSLVGLLLLAETLLQLILLWKVRKGTN